MPQGDKTGLRGKGAKTGRQLGNCKGTKPVAGAGRGMGFGRGAFCPRGFGNRRFFAGVNEKEFLEQEKAEIEKRLKELKN